MIPSEITCLPHDWHISPAWNLPQLHTCYSFPSRVESISSVFKSGWPVACSDQQNLTCSQSWALQNLADFSFCSLEGPKPLYKKVQPLCWRTRGSWGTRHVTQTPWILKPQLSSPANITWSRDQQSLPSLSHTAESEQRHDFCGCKPVNFRAIFSAARDNIY